MGGNAVRSQACHSFPCAGYRVCRLAIAPRGVLEKPFNVCLRCNVRVIVALVVSVFHRKRRLQGHHMFHVNLHLWNPGMADDQDPYAFPSPVFVRFIPVSMPREYPKLGYGQELFSG